MPSRRFGTSSLRGDAGSVGNGGGLALTIRTNGLHGRVPLGRRHASALGSSHRSPICTGAPRCYATSLRTCRARTSLMRVWYPTGAGVLPFGTDVPPMNRECHKSQSCAVYAARSRRLARRALMIRIASAIATSPECVGDHEHVSAGRSAKPQTSRFRRRVLQVRAVERLGIQEDRRGVIERDAVLRRVALALSRLPPHMHRLRATHLRGETYVLGSHR
jgi:hypothetical protein